MKNDFNSDEFVSGSVTQINASIFSKKDNNNTPCLTEEYNQEQRLLDGEDLNQAMTLLNDLLIAGYAQKKFAEQWGNDKSMTLYPLSGNQINTLDLFADALDIMESADKSVKKVYTC